MSHTDAKKIMGILVVAIVICCLLGILADATGSELLYVFSALVLVLVIGHYVVYLLYWRCPYCGTHLPIRGVRSLDYCPHCGNKL